MTVYPGMGQLDHAYQIFHELIDQSEEVGIDEEYYAAGILYSKKKYPALYSHGKEEWDDLFEELTKDFNREMKRGLKKLM